MRKLLLTALVQVTHITAIRCTGKMVFGATVDLLEAEGRSAQRSKGGGGRMPFIDRRCQPAYRSLGIWGIFLAAVLLLPLFLAAASADAQELLTLTPSQSGSQVRVGLEADNAPATSVTVTVQATLQGTAISETTSIMLGPDAAAGFGEFPVGGLPPGDYDFTVVTSAPPGIVSNALQGITTLTVELGVSYTLPDGPELPAGVPVSVIVTLNSTATVVITAEGVAGSSSGTRVEGRLENLPIVLRGRVPTSTVSFPADGLVQTVFFTEYIFRSAFSGTGTGFTIDSGIWRFTANGGSISLNNDGVTRLTIKEPVPATLTSSKFILAVGDSFDVILRVEPPGIDERVGGLTLDISVLGLFFGFPVDPLTTFTSGPVPANIRDQGEHNLNVGSGGIRSASFNKSFMVNALSLSVDRRRISVVLPTVTIEPEAPLIEVDSTMQRIVAAGSDVRFELSADLAPSEEVNITVSAVSEGTTMIVTAVLSTSTSTAEAVFSGPNALGEGTWKFSAAADVADRVAFQPIPSVVVLRPKITLTPGSGAEEVLAGRPVRLAVAAIPLAPSGEVTIEVMAVHADGTGGGMVTVNLSPDTATAQAVFTPPQMLGRTGEWTFTATAEPEGLVEVAQASTAVTVVLPSLVLTAEETFVIQGNPVRLLVHTNAPVQRDVIVTVTGMSSGNQTTMTVSLTPVNSTGTADFGPLAEGVWVFTASAAPEDIVETTSAVSQVTVVVNTERLLSSVSLTPMQIVEGASATLRVVITDAANTTRILSIQRDGTEESTLTITAGSTSAEVIVRGDGPGAYTYSLADPDNSFDNEGEFSLPLRVVADIRLSLEPVQGSLPIAGNAVRITASLLNATGSALRLEAGVTLTLQAEADTGGLIPDIALQIAEMTTSGATTFIPPTTGAWTVTVSAYLPSDALLAPTAEITSATIAVSPRLRLLLIPNASTVPFGNPITIRIVNTEPASEVEITGLTVRASQPGQTAVDRSLDSFALPAEIVFKLSTGTWSFEVAAAEPVYGIDISAATATVTVEDRRLDFSSQPDGVDADDLILLLRYLALCPGEAATDCQAMGTLTDGLSGGAAAYDLSQLTPSLQEVDLGSEPYILPLYNYLSGIRNERVFPASVPAAEHDRLLQRIRQLLGIE